MNTSFIRTLLVLIIRTIDLIRRYIKIKYKISPIEKGIHPNKSRVKRAISGYKLVEYSSSTRLEFLDSNWIKAH